MTVKLNVQHDFPLYEKRPELIFTPTGKAIDEINMESVLSGKVTSDDCRISPETLEYQAQIAESMGNWQVANNFRRAAELCKIPDSLILETYNLMRPYRSTEKELINRAEVLESKYNAKIIAGFLRETAEIYKQKNMLKNE